MSNLLKERHLNGNAHSRLAVGGFSIRLLIQTNRSNTTLAEAHQEHPASDCETDNGQIVVESGWNQVQLTGFPKSTRETFPGRIFNQCPN